MMPLLRGAASPPSIARHAAESPLAEDSKQSSRSWLNLVLRDVQFWVPVAVLVVGLIILRWIS